MFGATEATEAAHSHAVPVCHNAQPHLLFGFAADLEKILFFSFFIYIFFNDFLLGVGEGCLSVLGWLPLVEVLKFVRTHQRYSGGYAAEPS